MIYVIVTIHVIVSLFLILVVLLQQGKGADLAGAFGGGGSQTAFGARGATTILHKATVTAFVLFVVLCMALAIVQVRPRSSVMTGAAPATPAQTSTAPANSTPATPAPTTPTPVTPAPQQAPQQ